VLTDRNDLAACLQGVCHHVTLLQIQQCRVVSHFQETFPAFTTFDVNAAFFSFSYGSITFFRAAEHQAHLPWQKEPAPQG